VRITVTARHCTVPDELRKRARDLVQRLERVAARSLEAHVVFDLEDGSATVEVRLHRPGGVVHIATGSAVDHRSALDRAAAKVRRQIDKRPARGPR
jgi:ribosomal subunit interface protein